MSPMTIEQQAALFRARSAPFALNTKLVLLEERSVVKASDVFQVKPRNAGRMTLKEHAHAENERLGGALSNFRLFEDRNPGSGILEFKMVDYTLPELPSMYDYFVDYEDFYIIRETFDTEFKSRLEPSVVNNEVAAPIANPQPVLEDHKSSSGSEKTVSVKDETGSPSSQSSVFDEDVPTKGRPVLESEPPHLRAKPATPTKKKPSPSIVANPYLGTKQGKLKSMGMAIFDAPTKGDIARYGEDLSIDSYMAELQARAEGAKTVTQVAVKSTPEVFAVQPETLQSPSRLRLADQEPARSYSPSPSLISPTKTCEEEFTSSSPPVAATPPSSPSKENVSSPPMTPYARPEDPTPSKALRGHGKGFAMNLSPIRSSPSSSPVAQGEKFVAPSTTKITISLDMSAMMPDKVWVIEGMPGFETELSAEPVPLQEPEINVETEATEPQEPTAIPTIQVNGAIVIDAEDNEDDDFVLEIFTGDESVKFGGQGPTTQKLERIEEEYVEDSAEWTAVGALVTISGSYLLARALCYAPKTTAVVAGLGAMWFLTRKNN